MNAWFKNVMLGLSALGFVAVAMAQDKPAPTTKPYVLDNCVVSGEKLGSMGDPISYMYEGQEFKFCCSNCEGDFKKNPQNYLKTYQESAAKAPTTKPAAK